MSLDFDFFSLLFMSFLLQKPDFEDRIQLYIISIPVLRTQIAILQVCVITAKLH